MNCASRRSRICRSNACIVSATLVQRVRCARTGMRGAEKSGGYGGNRSRGEISIASSSFAGSVRDQLPFPSVFRFSSASFVQYISRRSRLVVSTISRCRRCFSKSGSGRFENAAPRSRKPIPEEPSLGPTLQPLGVSRMIVQLVSLRTLSRDARRAFTSPPFRASRRRVWSSICGGLSFAKMTPARSAAATSTSSQLGQETI